MNSKTKIVYVLNVRNDELNMEYSAGVYSNIDLAMRKALDIVSGDMDSFNTLLNFSEIAFSNNNDNAIYSKDVIEPITDIFKIIVKNILNDSNVENLDKNTEEELILTAKHLIPNINQQDIHEEFLSYIYHWTQLFQQYNVSCDSIDHIQLKIKQMVDGYQGIYVVEEFSDFDNINFTFEQLQQHYPNIKFHQGLSNSHELSFSINDYWNFEPKNHFYSITRFILDE